jgi:hypothetical protein
MTMNQGLVTTFGTNTIPSPGNWLPIGASRGINCQDESNNLTSFSIDINLTTPNFLTFTFTNWWTNSK